MTQADPTADHALVTQSALDSNWRFEEILHLGGMTVDETLPSALRNALDDWLDEIAPAVGVPAAEDESVADWLERLVMARRFGFLVRAATPCRQYGNDPSTYAFTWGRYVTQWFYAETLSELVPRVEAWVQGFEDEERQRSQTTAPA